MTAGAQALEKGGISLDSAVIISALYIRPQNTVNALILRHNFVANPRADSHDSAPPTGLLKIFFSLQSRCASASTITTFPPQHLDLQHGSDPLREPL